MPLILWIPSKFVGFEKFPSFANSLHDCCMVDSGCSAVGKNSTTLYNYYYCYPVTCI